MGGGTLAETSVMPDRVTRGDCVSDDGDAGCAAMPHAATLIDGDGVALDERACGIAPGDQAGLGDLPAPPSRSLGDDVAGPGARAAERKALGAVQHHADMAAGLD